LRLSDTLEEVGERNSDKLKVGISINREYLSEIYDSMDYIEEGF